MTQEHDAETVRILQCPFCGGQASMSKSYDPDTSGAFHHIQCHKCRAKGGEFYAVETCPIFYGQVRDAWNAREVTGWQPIETAPKDRAILFYASGYYVGHFNTAYEKWCTCTDGTKTSGERLLNSWNSPTHWKPLDPAPEGV